MEDFELEIKQDFLAESEDLLQQAESAFLRLDTERDNPEIIYEIFRLAHNLKGASKAVGFDQLAELTHIAENLILKLKEGDLKVSDPILNVLLEFKDKVHEIIEILKSDMNAQVDIDDMKQHLEEMTNSEASEENSPAPEEGEVDVPNEDLESAGEEAVASLDQKNEDSSSTVMETSVQNDDDIIDLSGYVSERGEGERSPQDKKQELLLEIEGMFAAQKAEGNVSEKQSQELQNELKKIKPKSQVAPPAPALKKDETSPSPQKTAAQSAAIDESIRVSLTKINDINNIIGELVILQTVLNLRRFHFIEDDLANKSIGQMAKLFKEVQEMAMSLRMLPVKGVFQKMARIVRDTSKSLNKDVKFTMIGEETEVDKTVLEKLADPLVHIVRNAVDHGLESPEEREKSGKDKVGTVELLAQHEGSNLVIMVTDDGKGIDPEVIREKAINKGVINANASLSENDIFQLLFHPGFSTKEKVTEVSGRGVGMDVVKTNIEQLGGEVKIMSKLHQGSSFKIVLPLTLAIIDGLIIKASHEDFVIPLSQVHELTKITPEHIEKFSSGLTLYKLRGDVIPIFMLNDKLGYQSSFDGSKVALIIKGLNYTFGVVVDDVRNQQQIVIKKLGEDIRGQKGFMGSAIMGNGKPAFILDLFEIFKDDIKHSRAYQKLVNKAPMSA